MRRALGIGIATTVIALGAPAAASAALFVGYNEDRGVSVSVRTVVRDEQPRTERVAAGVGPKTARRLAGKRVRISCGQEKSWQTILATRWPRDARRRLRARVDGPVPRFDHCRLDLASGKRVATVQMLRAE
jgi:hypothetical protein